MKKKITIPQAIWEANDSNCFLLKVSRISSLIAVAILKYDSEI